MRSSQDLVIKSCNGAADEISADTPGMECGVAGRLHTSILTRPDEIQALRPEWDALWWRADGNYIHSPVGCLSAWQDMMAPLGGELRVIACFDDDALVALLPLVRQRKSLWHILHPVRSIAADVSDILVESSPRATLYVEAVWRAVHERMRADVILLRFVKSTTPLGKLLASADRATSSEPNVAPHVVWKAGETWEHYYRSLSSGGRKVQTKKRRQLQGLGKLEFETTRTSRELRESIDWLLREKRSWADQTGKRGTWLFSKHYERFLAQLAAGAKSEASPVMFLLKLDGETIAAQLAMEGRAHIDLIIASFSARMARHSPGMMLNEYCMRYALDRGLDVEFGPGQEYNKTLWSRGQAHETASYRLVLTSWGVAGQRLAECRKSMLSPVRHFIRRSSYPPKGSTAEATAHVDDRGPRTALRVLHVTRGGIYGGVDTALISLARYRRSCPDLEQHFAYCMPGRFQREMQATGADAIDLGQVRLSRFWTVLRARRRFRSLLALDPYDVVVCHSPWAMILFGSLLRGNTSRLIFWLHDVPLRHPGFGSVRGLLERLARRVRPDFVICNSHFTSQHLSDQYPGIESRVIYCPVELRSAAGSRRSSLRHELGAGPETVVVIQVGRMAAWKGHLATLQALAAVVSDWQCWLVGGAQQRGEAAYLAELKAFAAMSGIGDRVRFLGAREDVPDLLEAADIFCQPNIRPEPFGIVYVEAMNAGLPVIAGDMGGAREIVTPDCGMLVAPNDPEALVAALRRMIGDPALRASLGRNGPARASELCAPTERLAELRQTLVELVPPAQAPRRSSPG